MDCFFSKNEETANAIIYHISSSLFSMASFAKDKTSFVGSHLGEYRIIGEITIPSYMAEAKMIDKLEYVYSASNSVESNWFENEGVVLVTPGSKHRSTSIGDIVKIDGEMHMVDSYGFSRIQDTLFGDTIMDTPSTNKP